MKHLIYSIPLLLLWSFSVQPTNVFALDAGCSALNSVKICQEPALPTLPAAGGTFTDPTFGTTIMRVTDQNDGNTNYHLYAAFWPPFSYDSSIFWIKDGNTPRTVNLYALNTSTFTTKKLGNMWGASGNLLQDDTLQWHRGGGNVNRIYGVQNLTKKLYQIDLDVTTSPYNPNNNSWTLIKDFGSAISGYPDYMTMSDDNDTFHFVVGSAGASGSSVVATYKRSTDTLYTFNFNQAPYNKTSLHASMLDKSGTYALVNGGGGSDWYVLNVVQGTVEIIDYDSTDRAGGHRALGNKKVYHVDAWVGDARKLFVRDLSNNPQTETAFASPLAPKGTAQEGYVSIWGSSNESWLIATSFRIGGQATFDGPWQGEIYKAWTDTNNLTHVQRLVHHRSNADSYNEYGRAAVSFDGNYVMFTSDWEHQTGNRYDVFILKVPPLSGSSDSLSPLSVTGLKQIP